MHMSGSIFWLAGLGAAGLWAAGTLFSREARLQRRRRKSHSRIIAKTHRPMVRFNVRPPKK